jgi:hypothetical protein
MSRLWGVIAFLTIPNSGANLSDTYRVTFGDTHAQCQEKCLYDVRCYGYWYDFSTPTNLGCYLKGGPRFDLWTARLGPYFTGIKVRHGDRPWK